MGVDASRAAKGVLCVQKQEGVVSAETQQTARGSVGGRRTQGQKQTEELSGAGMGSCLQRTDARHAAASLERGAQRVMEQDAWSVLEKGLSSKEDSAGEEEDAKRQMGGRVLSA